MTAAFFILLRKENGVFRSPTSKPARQLDKGGAFLLMCSVYWTFFNFRSFCIKKNVLKRCCKQLCLLKTLACSGSSLAPERLPPPPLSTHSTSDPSPLPPLRACNRTWRCTAVRQRGASHKSLRLPPLRAAAAA